MAQECVSLKPVFHRVLIFFGLCLAALLSFASTTTCVAQSASWLAPSATYQGAAMRRALLILSISPSSSNQEAGISETAGIYRRRLGDLGFETAIVGSGSRPDIDRTLRTTLETVPAGSDLAIFVLGPTIPAGQDIFILPRDAAPAAERAAEPPDSELLRLSNFLRRLQGKRLSNLVVLVDDCRPAAGACTIADLGASLVTIEPPFRQGRSASDDAKVRQTVLSGMTVEGRTFEQFHAGLKQELEGAGFKLQRSPTLSRTFQFHETGFFLRAPSDCMKIEQYANEASARSAQIPVLVQRCAAIVAQRPYVSVYQDRLAAGREQLAFQNAVASCSNEAARQAYLTTYPNGRFVSIVQQNRERCTPPAPPPALPPQPAPQTLPPPASQPPPVAVSPSFNCQQVNFAVEQMICAYSELAAADLQMVAAFNQLARSLAPFAAERLRQDQVTWLRIRNSACGLPRSRVSDVTGYASARNCLRAVIQQRTNELR